MINHLNYSKLWSNIIIFTIIMVFNVVQCKCCDLVTQTRNCPPKSSCLGKCPVLLQSIVNIITVHIQYKAMKKNHFKIVLQNQLVWRLSCTKIYKRIISISKTSIFRIFLLSVLPNNFNWFFFQSLGRNNSGEYTCRCKHK